MKLQKVEEMKKEFTEEFIKALNEDKMIWERGWEIRLHQNLVSQLDYKGYNQLLLMYISQKRGYQENKWLTFNQATSKELKIKKGAKSIPIEYFSFFDKKNKKSITYKEYQIAIEEGRKEDIRVVNKYYNIFNVEDIEGYENKNEVNNNDISLIENYITYSNLKVKFVGNQPCYIPAFHEIQIPNRNQFKNDDEYYSTLFHELSHSTIKHIEREFPEDVKTDKEKYAFEELIAEISSVLLCCEFQIQLSSIQNNKSYVQSWIEKLKDDKEKYLMKAIKNANQVTKHIIDHIE